MSRFDDVIGSVLSRAGGYFDGAGDPQAERKWGIVKGDFPDLAIAALAQEQAIEIYRQRVWLPLLEQIEEPAKLVKVFDLIADIGRAAAVALLRDAMTELGWQIPAGPMGANLIQAINLVPTAGWFRAVRQRHARHYVNRVLADPALAPRLDTWLARAVS